MKKTLLLFIFPIIFLEILWLPATVGGSEASMKERYQEFGKEMSSALASLPIRVFSEDRKGVLDARIFAVLDRDFSDLAKVLSTPSNWCEIVPVVLNVKACTWQEGKLTFYVGRKFYEPPEDAYRLKYDFNLMALRDGYFHVALQAEKGPFGTSDYLLEVEAIKVSDKTFLSFHTSYHSSTVSRLATRGYLATLGSDKIGFSVIGGTRENPIYIQGFRGIVERNAVRYYLALQAYMETRHYPPEERFAAASELWFDLTERYHDQLYEMDKAEYLDTKRRERIQQLRLQKQSPHPSPAKRYKSLSVAILSVSDKMLRKAFSENSQGALIGREPPTPQTRRQYESPSSHNPDHRPHFRPSCLALQPWVGILSQRRVGTHPHNSPAALAFRSILTFNIHNFLTGKELWP